MDGFMFFLLAGLCLERPRKLDDLNISKGPVIWEFCQKLHGLLWDQEVIGCDLHPNEEAW
jgi:hypothetical protein